MPKILKKFEFKSTTIEAKYDWATLFDGKIREMVHGTEEQVESKDADYACETQTFRMMAYKQAHKRGKLLKASASESGIVIQAEDATPEQIAEWEAKEVARKEAKAAKKAAAKANGEAEGDEDGGEAA